MIPKTDFLSILENIHKNTDWRYGQIIYNACAQACHPLVGVKNIGLRFTKESATSAMFDFFYVSDEDFTLILLNLRDTLKNARKDNSWID